MFQDERPHRLDSNPRQQPQPNYDSMTHQHRRPRVQFTSSSERNMVLNNSSSNSTVGSTGSDARYTISKNRPSSSPSPSTRRTHHFYLSNTATSAAGTTATSPGGSHQNKKLQRMNSGGSVSSDAGSGSVKSAPGWQGQYDSNSKTMTKNNSSHAIGGGGKNNNSSGSSNNKTTQKNKKTTPSDVAAFPAAAAAAAQTELPTKQQTKQTKKVIDGTFNYRNPNCVKYQGTDKASTQSVHTWAEK